MQGDEEMQELVIDSREARDDLMVAGFDQAQTDAIVGTVRAFREGLATQADIRDVRSEIRELRGTMANLASQLQNFKAITSAKFDLVGHRIATVEKELERLKGQVSVVGSEILTLRTDVQELKAALLELRADFKTQTGQRVNDRWMFGLTWALLLVLLAAEFR